LADAACERRRALFGPVLCAEPPWRILIKLYLRGSATAEALASGCDLPLSVAHRWLALLAGERWVSEDGGDLRLTPNARDAVENVLGFAAV
jgi:hypothetical protein